jgi:RimJ/RimL family protein N-acetyltransferase
MMISMGIQDFTRRPMSRDDWPLVREWRNSPEVFLFMGTGREITIDEHMSWFESRLKDFKVNPVFGYYSEDVLIATTRLDFTEKKIYELGIIVNPNFRRKGVALFCLNDTVAYFFSASLTKNKIVFAKVHPENEASLNLFKKAGFVDAQINQSGYRLLKKELVQEFS